jgi:hypothetical protein
VSGTLDDLYLIWLYEQVGDVKVQSRARTYWDLFRQLYSIEFVWFIPNDDNRAQDGLCLREQFLEDRGMDIFDVDPDWMGSDCSFLEMLVALARRLSFEAEGEPSLWFWHMIENIGLENCTDLGKYDQGKVDTIVRDVIFRTYDYDGHGGLFPLRRARSDQRETEIWYQMNEYLLEG